jgi:hypothetical protein
MPGVEPSDSKLNRNNQKDLLIPISTVPRLIGLGKVIYDESV